MNMFFNAFRRIVNEYINEASIISLFERQNVLLGKHVSIGNDCIVGEYTYIGSYTKIEHCTIGRYTSIGDNCTIAPGEHRIKQISTSYRIYKDRIGLEYYDGDDGKLSKGVTIGNDVWIGCNVTIRRGVNIGNGAVVGANSYVNRNVPDYAVVGGVPARIIKYRFNREEIYKISKSSWWDLGIDEARIVIEEISKEIC